MKKIPIVLTIAFLGMFICIKNMHQTVHGGIVTVSQILLKMNLDNAPEYLQNINNYLRTFPIQEANAIRSAVTLDDPEFLQRFAAFHSHLQDILGHKMARSYLNQDIFTDLYWMQKDNNFVLVKIINNKDILYVTPTDQHQALPKNLYYWWLDYIKNLPFAIVRQQPNGQRFWYDKNIGAYIPRSK